MDDNIKEHILDYIVGDASYWKHRFEFVLDDIENVILNGLFMVVSVMKTTNLTVGMSYS